MRVLVLCAAAFAGGLLAGALVWPGTRGAPQRATTPRPEPARPAAEPQTAYERVRPGAETADSAAEVTLRTAAGERRVRELAQEAAVELDRVLASERAAAVLSGDGRITGTVRDASGDPVAGVVVTATPGAQPFALSLSGRRARERPHEDRPLDVVAQEAIEGELWRRHVRRSAPTGSDGRYELTGLMKAGHALAAFHEGYDVQPVSRQNSVEPDAVVDFVAEPVTDVRVEVRMPDGSVAENAWLVWNGPHGRDWDMWTRENGSVRLPAGSCRVKAQTWVPEPLQSAEVDYQVRPAAEGDVLVLQLEGRRVLVAQLRLPDGYVMPDAVEFRMQPLGDAAPFDPASIDRARLHSAAASPSPGRAAWFDLEPGEYLVAAFLDQRRLLAHTVVAVGEGTTEVELEVPEPASGSALAVTLLSPEGGPVVEGVRFLVLAGAGADLRHLQSEVLRRADGTWLVLLPETGDAEEAVVRVTTQNHGWAEQPFNPKRPAPVTIRLAQPVRLRASVDRYAGSGVEGRLHAALVNDRALVASRQVGPDGECDFGLHQPGDYRLVLYLRGGDQRWPILRRAITLGARDREERLAVPSLHVLRVRPSPELRVQGVTLLSSDPAIGSLRRQARLADGVATFDALAAGDYEVRCGPRHVEVRVPGPAEVSVE